MIKENEHKIKYVYENGKLAHEWEVLNFDAGMIFFRDGYLDGHLEYIGCKEKSRICWRIRFKREFLIPAEVDISNLRKYVEVI